MAADTLSPNSTVAGTLTGTAVAVIANISSQDVTKTAVLAAIGAVVSFGVSVLLKRILRCLK